ncbi:MAG: Peptidase C14 caspase catalytic subunit p20 [Parcubacteria group bacterium GW2011_GWA2_47_7]|nr:MAG: Peptidase C14 caspase catalytic subunit p20 [Parcubacteria group bacterium GW2011_GWA2_47_7]
MLEGGAATTDGLISASGVMSYVYEKVAGDQYSHQTPHYGFVEGDGDFIFDTSILGKLLGPNDTSAASENKKGEENDVLINTSPQTAGTELEEEAIVETMKELLSEPSKKIKLNDFVERHIKIFLDKIDLRHFPAEGVGASNEEFFDRIKKYEESAHDIQRIAVLLTQWGTPDQLMLLKKILVRTSEVDRGSSGTILWLNLSWYPIQFLMYSAGIAAVAEQKYDALKVILETPVHLVPDTIGKELSINEIVSRRLSEISDSFKTISGHERHYVPRSEYLFKTLQPTLEDLLFLGRSYEEVFDKYEIFAAWSYVNQHFVIGGDARGPIGRFGWKSREPFGGKNLIPTIIEEAKRERESWKPLKAGFFGASFTRFVEISGAFNERLDKLNWF